MDDEFEHKRQIELSRKAEILRAVKAGDIDALDRLFKANHHFINYSSTANIVVQYGSIEILEYVMSKTNYINLMMIMNNAIRYLRFDVIDWCAPRIIIDTSYSWDDLAVGKVKNVVLLDYLHRLGWVPNHCNLWDAFYHQNAMVCNWICSHLSAIPTNYLIMRGEKCTVEIAQCVQKYGLNGHEYQICEGHCSVCRTIQCLNDWEMNDETFTHYIQWLPRELLEDFIECFPIV